MTDRLEPTADEVLHHIASWLGWSIVTGTGEGGTAGRNLTPSEVMRFASRKINALTTPTRATKAKPVAWMWKDNRHKVVFTPARLMPKMSAEERCAVPLYTHPSEAKEEALEEGHHIHLSLNTDPPEEGI